MHYLSISGNYIPIMNMQFEKSVCNLIELGYFHNHVDYYVVLKKLLDNTKIETNLRKSIIRKLETSSISSVIIRTRKHNKQWIIGKYFLGMNIWSPDISQEGPDISQEGIVPLIIPCVKRNPLFSYISPVYIGESSISRMVIENKYIEPFTTNINSETISEWIIMVNTCINRNLLKFYLREVLGILPKAKFPKIVYCTTKELETEFGEYVVPTEVIFDKEKQKGIFQKFVFHLADYMNNTDQRSRNHDVLKENMFFEASASCVYVQNSTTQDGEQAFEPSPISFVIEENDT